MTAGFGCAPSARGCLGGEARSRPGSGFDLSPRRLSDAPLRQSRRSQVRFGKGEDERTECLCEDDAVQRGGRHQRAVQQLLHHFPRPLARCVGSYHHPGCRVLERCVVRVVQHHTERVGGHLARALRIVSELHPEDVSATPIALAARIYTPSGPARVEKVPSGMRGCPRPGTLLSNPDPGTASPPLCASPTTRAAAATQDRPAQ